jgi:predicted amino acid-binding ACT domain protein
MNAMVNIGCMGKEGIVAARDAIISILEVNVQAVDPVVLKEALTTLSNMSRVDTVNVSYCRFHRGEKEPTMPDKG